MAKTKISSTDLVWIFCQELRAFDDVPPHGIPVAIVPTADAGWQALMSPSIRGRRKLWARRVEALQRRLQKAYTLVG
jgi:hypothetical protein